MYRLFAAIVILIIISCNNERSRETTGDTTMQPVDTTSQATDEKNVSGCYLRVLQRDALAATLEQEGNTITGKLTFDNYQKDGSSGTVTGTIDNDILKLIYRFHAEGMNSIAEEYFRITPGGLIHGIGEVQVKGDSAYHPDPASLKYAEENKLLKIPCAGLPAKYQ